MVSFQSIPSDWKIPGTSIEVDPSLAGTPVSLEFALLVGYKNTSGGSAPSNLPVPVGNLNDAIAFFGAGSMLTRMYQKFLDVNRGQVVYCLPIDAPAAGVAATGTITVASAATEAGTLYLYIAGQRVTVSVLTTDTTANVATKINVAINALTSLPVTSTVLASAVTLTAKHKGITGNDITMMDNYRGAYGGEQMPLGLALTYSAGALASGTGVPDWTLSVAGLGDLAFLYVALPFTDSGTRSTWATEYGFGDNGRWGWMRQSYGQCFSARRDTYSNQFTWGLTTNEAVISTMGIEVKTPSPVWEWTTVYTARAARALSIDPGRPLQTLKLEGVLPAPYGMRYSETELNGLAHAGIAIQGTDLHGSTGGVPMILREQSGYQRNELGMADNAFEVVTTLATLARIFTRLRQSISNKFPRHKLANDGTRFGPGQAIVTPNVIKAELIAEYDLMEYEGLVENVQAFIDNLIVERSITEPNTVEAVYPPDLINQLRRFNVLAQFRLQFATFTDA